MQTELRLRILSGIVMAAVVLVTTWYGGLAFRMLAVILSLLVYYEWSTITRLAEEDFRANAIGWLSQIAVAIATVSGETFYAVCLLVAFAAVAIALAGLKTRNWWFPIGIVYAGLLGIALSEIRDDNALGLVAMLFIFAVVWATDILAYFIGRAIGGPKLAPRISPGKTWSGAIGGAVSAVIAGTGVALAFFPGTGFGVAIIALLLSVCSQSGDLFESFIKRRFGVKDSSHLIPGHGGVMDRIDGLIFACSAAFLIAVVLSLLNPDQSPSLGAVLFGL